MIGTTLEILKREPIFAAPSRSSSIENVRKWVAEYRYWRDWHRENPRSYFAGSSPRSYGAGQLAIALAVDRWLERQGRAIDFRRHLWKLQVNYYHWQHANE